MSGWRRLWPECVLMLMVLVGFGLAAHFFFTRHYLHQPFFFDTNDALGDWFNTAYWSRQKGTYDVWKTVYPPISFAFLNIFGINEYYMVDPSVARQEDWFGKLVILSLYFINVIFAYASLWKADKGSAIFRATAFAVGLPILYALDRANLILVAIPFFIIAYGPRLGFLGRKSKGPGSDQTAMTTRGLAMAIVLNFKPNLVLMCGALAVKRRWRALEVLGLSFILVYTVTFLMIGKGSPFELINNLRDFSTNANAQIWERIFDSTGFDPLTAFDKFQFPVRRYIQSETVDMMNFVIPLVIRSTQLLVAFCLVGAWLQPRALSVARLSTLIYGAYTVTLSPSTYYMMALVYLVFLEQWRRPGPIIAISCAYVLCIPYDWVASYLFSKYQSVWLSGQEAYTQYGIGVGMFTRPGAVLILTWALAIDSVYLIIRAHKAQRPTLWLGTQTMARAYPEPSFSGAST